MPNTLETVYAPTRAAWRRWLKQHHASSPGIWLVRHRQHTGVKSLAYEDLVCEALCFGWIDSLVKRLDEDRFMTKVTPRKPTSNWSEPNRKRWKHLEAEGLLAPAGIAAAPAAGVYRPKPVIPELPAYIAKAFKAQPKAWQHFQSLTPRQRSFFVGWIHTAKREETRAKRVAESLKLLVAGKTLGLK
jgi:uncharacterized protein YdeI (YjbR/CyaY-like superfamily)